MSGCASRRGKSGVVGRRRAWLRPLLLGTMLLVAGCSAPARSDPAGRDATPTVTASPDATAPASAAASASAAPAGDATAPPSCVDQVLTSMTEAQRIGQLFMVGIGAGPEPVSTELRQIAASHLGSVWYTMRTTAGVAWVRQLSDQVQAVAGASSTDGVGFLIGANQEGGLVQALGGPGFDTIPSAVTQGKLSASTLEGLAAAWGRQLRAAGVDVDFAPVADVVPPGTDATNAPIGQLDRELGHDPTVSATHVAAFIAGMRAAGILATAKHFPGLGRVQGNTDDTAGVIDPLTSATDPALAPFRAAVHAGVPFVMVSLATYPRLDPGHLAAFSPLVIDGLLRGDLGFDGVVLSDSLTAAAVSTVPPGTSAIDFLVAGGDLVVLTGTTTAVEMASAVAARVDVDATFRARVDDAARRVLEMKSTVGLLPCS